MKKIGKVFAVLAAGAMSLMMLGSCEERIKQIIKDYEPQPPKTAYEVAVKNGFEGTEEEWIASLVGDHLNGVVDMEVDYLVDEEGNPYISLTLIYADGTTQTLEVELATTAITEAELREAFAKGGNVALGNDITVMENLLMLGGIFDGGNKTLDGTYITENNGDCLLTTLGGTVKDLNIVAAACAIGSGSSGDYFLNDNLIIDNVNIDGGIYAINIGIGNGYKMTVKDSVLYGWTSFNGLSKAEFNACIFGKGASTQQYMQIGDDTTFSDCMFADGYKLSSNVGGLTITFENCTYNGTTITAENFAELLTELIADDADVESMKLCTVIVDGVTVDVASYR